MYAAGCRSAKSKGVLGLYTGTTLIQSFSYDDSLGFGSMYFANLAAGTYTIKFQATWTTVDVKDYTIGVYAAEKVSVMDSNGKTNQV